MPTASPTETAPDARADALLALFERAGYARVAPAILQPAEPFLDLSGEEIRKRMYLTTDPQGRELCLRPDLTIPVSRDYLASPAAGSAQNFCYLGPVFRHHADAAVEFLQAGIESFGRADTAAAMPRCSRSASTPPRITESRSPTSASVTWRCSPH